MSNEVEETTEVESIEQEADDLSIDANLEEIEAYLQSGYPSDEEESEVEEETPVEEEQVSETETDEGGENEYYTMEQLTDVSADDIIDGKFDSSRIQPGSPVEKFVKGFERAYTKKFTDVADMKKELLENKAQIEALSKTKSFDADSFFEKQKQFEQEKLDAEEESLLTDEERMEVRQKRDAQQQIKELSQRTDYVDNELRELRLQATNSRIEAMIAKAGAKYGVDVDEENARIQREIGWKWDQDKAEGLEPHQYTPVDAIMEQVAIDVKRAGKPVLTEDFWDTEDGKAMKQKIVAEEVARIKSLKNSGGNIAPSTSRTTSDTDIVDTNTDISSLDDQSLEHWLRTGEMY